MYLWSGLVAFGVVVISLFSGWWSALGVAVLALTTAAVTFGLPGHRGVIPSQER
jgi:UDP-GlcNAc:undecaprenyl-phosphate GlcNAc-1-phosphate transferase